MSGETISTTKPRRPLIVAGHCRRLLMLLRRSWCCAQRCCDGAATESRLRRSCAD